MTCINKFDLRVLILEHKTRLPDQPVRNLHVGKAGRCKGGSPIIGILCFVDSDCQFIRSLLFQLKETKENNNVLLIVVQLVN